jgi:hypothetical protein
MEWTPPTPREVEAMNRPTYSRTDRINTVGMEDH